MTDWKVYGEAQAMLGKRFRHRHTGEPLGVCTSVDQLNSEPHVNQWAAWFNGDPCASTHHMDASISASPDRGYWFADIVQEPK